MLLIIIEIYIFFRDDLLRRKTIVVAIDALKINSNVSQFSPKCIIRELNKAYVGFCDSGSTMPIATGSLRFLENIVALVVCFIHVALICCCVVVLCCSVALLFCCIVVVVVLLVVVGVLLCCCCCCVVVVVVF